MSDVKNDPIDGESGDAPSATQLKKMRRYEMIKMKKKEKRKEVKLRQKINRQQQSAEQLSCTTDYVTKREQKELKRKKCEDALINGIRVAVNCAFEENMNKKECCKLAGQIRRLYGANMKAPSPFHIYLANMDEEGPLFKECCRQNDGFMSYRIDRTDQSILELFPDEDVTLLTPDSENVLKELDPNGVYVIGGLVDHQILKRKTVQLASQMNLKTARLPIPEHMEKINTSGTGSCVLTVNQVFEILLDYSQDRDWVQALKNVPKRTGWTLKNYLT